MKWFGKIGFVKTEETKPGVHSPSEKEREYYGDVTTNRWRWDKSDMSSNDDIQVTNSISIVADSYMTDNLGYMRYVVWNGTRWKISSFQQEYPRITLELGGLYV